MFDRYGKIGDVFIPRDRQTGRSRGFAFVRFAEERDADAAVTAEQGRTIAGRAVTLEKVRLLVTSRCVCRSAVVSR